MVRSEKQVGPVRRCPHSGSETTLRVAPPLVERDRLAVQVKRGHSCPTAEWLWFRVPSVAPNCRVLEVSNFMDKSASDAAYFARDVVRASAQDPRTQIHEEVAAWRWPMGDCSPSWNGSVQRALLSNLVPTSTAVSTNGQRRPTATQHSSNSRTPTPFLASLPSNVFAPLTPWLHAGTTPVCGRDMGFRVGFCLFLSIAADAPYTRVGSSVHGDALPSSMEFCSIQ